MDRALKQRLLGAVILTALLVILVPEWLDGAGHRSRYPGHIEIPPAPAFKPMPEPATQTTPQPAVSTRTAPEPAAPVESPPPAAKPPSSLHAWALQVGSFNDQSNALVMRDRMRAKGYAAYIDKQTAGKTARYRVRIGPELDRARVDKLKDDIQQKEKIKGMVVNHP